MKRIRFSHDYPKLHGQTSAELLAVREVKIDGNTAPELIEYDTAFDGGHFPLEHGDYIQLIFLGNLGIPFCTLRAAESQDKLDYYSAAVGEAFELVAVDEAEAASKQKDLEARSGGARDAETSKATDATSCTACSVEPMPGVPQGIATGRATPCQEKG